MQKNGGGLHTASSCYWDNATDGYSYSSIQVQLLLSLFHCLAGSCTIRWENKTMYCVVSVFGLSV